MVFCQALHCDLISKHYYIIKLEASASRTDRLWVLVIGYFDAIPASLRSSPTCFLKTIATVLYMRCAIFEKGA